MKRMRGIVSGVITRTGALVRLPIGQTQRRRYLLTAAVVAWAFANETTISQSAIEPAASLALTHTQNVSNPFELRQPPFLGQDSTRGFFSNDVTLAIGPRHFVLVRNSAITLFEKTDNDGRRQVNETSLGTFFAAASHPNDRLTDPMALYDLDNGRFFIANAAFNTCLTADTCDGGLQLAVSKTSTPKTLSDADWYFFASIARSGGSTAANGAS